MARGINKVILVGTLGADPEVKYMPSGGSITNIRIATSEAWKDKNTGEKKEATEWHRITFYNRLAEIAGEYLRKGRQVYIEGRLQTRSWEKDGQKHYATEIIANEMQMLGTGKSEGIDSGRYDENAPAPRNTSGGNYASNTPAPAANQGGSSNNGSNNFEDFDDDIPF